MAWTIAFKKDVFKFLDKQDGKVQERIKESLRTLLACLNKGTMPQSEIDIKRLKGKRKGFMRMRIGKIRLLFKIETSLQKVTIYAINYRGDAYKD